MEKLTTYNINEEDLKALVAFLMIKFVLASLSKQADSLNPELMVKEAIEFIERNKSTAV